MSAWERARHIPWSKIPQDGSNLEAQREQIFRQLQRETIEDELRSQERNLASASAGGGGGGAAEGGAGAVAADGSSKSKTWTAMPYSTMELLRQAAFGGTIGSITGAVFGFMDGMRVAASGDNAILAKASNQAKSKFIFQGTTRSAFVFGSFFGGFHVVKYGIRVVADPGDVPEILIASGISMGALAYKPAMRASMPYAAMLIFMDTLQMFMKHAR